MGYPLFNAFLPQYIANSGGDEGLDTYTSKFPLFLRYQQNEVRVTDVFLSLPKLRHYLHRGCSRLYPRVLHRRYPLYRS